MISIVEAISDLLFARDTVVVPGLGAFVRQSRSAQVDQETNHFSMPSSIISFEPNLREENDVIIRCLVEEYKISENEAKRMLFHFVSDTFNNLRAGKKVVLEHVGTLSYGPENEIVFEQDEDCNYNTDSFGLSDFSLKPVVRPEVKQEVEVAEVQPEVQNEMPEAGEVGSQPSEEEESRQISKGVWVFLIALMLVMSGILYFDVFRSHNEEEGLASEMELGPDDNSIDPQLIENMVDEVLGQIIREEISESSVMVGNTVQDTIRIIAGCYNQEEFALRIANSLRNKGYPNAFVEKRGERWFVAYDRYHTEEEAREALREIREVRGDKGWILKD